MKLNVRGVLGVLGVLNKLNVLNVPKDASLACWALFYSVILNCMTGDKRRAGAHFRK